MIHLIKAFKARVIRAAMQPNVSIAAVCLHYRQEGILSRAGLALARSTLGQRVGCGLRWQPLADALKAEVLNKGVLHTGETPVRMFKPGAANSGRGPSCARTGCSQARYAAAYARPPS